MHTDIKSLILVFVKQKYYLGEVYNLDIHNIFECFTQNRILKLSSSYIFTMLRQSEYLLKNIY